MSSRSARRNRHRSAPAAKAKAVAVPRPAATPTATFTADQVAGLMMQQQLARGQVRASPLPSSPFWESAPFGPGERLIPSPINLPRPSTGRAEPRLWEYPVSVNLQVAERLHLPWKVLQEATNIPLFRKCIERRKSVCSMDFTITVDPRHVAREAESAKQSERDVASAMRDKYAGDITRCLDWLQVPDRGNGWDWGQWTGLLMENRLTFDAAPIYPRRTYGGDLFSLESIDGKLIKPLWDEYGRRPLPPYPSFQQILYGFPRGEYIADAEIGADGQPFVPGGYSTDELMYERTVIRNFSPYGLSATEIALMDGLIWMRRMGWIMAEYDVGVMPSAYLETDSELGWDLPQWEAYATALNDMLSGNTDERHRWPLMPPGVKPVQASEVDERYKPDYDLFLIKLIAGDFGLPASEVGFTEPGALGASFHSGEEDILNRQTRLPDAKWLASVATKAARRYLGMPSVLQVQILGLESEDEAADDAVASDRIARGVMSRNEDRARIGLSPLNFPEADMMTVDVGRGVVFLDGASKLGAPGTLITPPQAPPASAPPPADVGMGGAADGDDDQDEDEDQQQRRPVTKAAEMTALRKFLARSRKRPFECQVLTAADVPDLASDPRVVLKGGGDAPKVRASAGSGRAGAGTLTS